MADGRSREGRGVKWAGPRAGDFGGLGKMAARVPSFTRLAPKTPFARRVSEVSSIHSAAEGSFTRSAPRAAVDTKWESGHLWICLLALGFDPRLYHGIQLGRLVLGRAGGGRRRGVRAGSRCHSGARGGSVSPWPPRGPVPLATERAREMPGVQPQSTLSQSF